MQMANQRSLQFQIWAPFGFCAVLTLLKQYSSGGSGDPAYYSFLPMCFFGVAAVQLSLLKRIKTLELMINGHRRVGESTMGA